MFTVMKRAFCVTLALMMLLCMLASCKKDNEDTITPTGEVGAEAIKNPDLYVWTGDGKKSDSVSDLMSDDATYEQLKAELAKGNRMKYWVFSLKNLKDFEGKKLTKVSFVLEADRAVTLTVSVGYSTYADCDKTITLEANKAQTVEIELNECYFKNDAGLFVHFYQKAEGKKAADHYGYNTDELGEWSQTVYKVTDFKLFCA